MHSFIFIIYLRCKNKRFLQDIYSIKQTQLTVILNFLKNHYHGFAKDKR